MLLEGFEELASALKAKDPGLGLSEVLGLELVGPLREDDAEGALAGDLDVGGVLKGDDALGRVAWRM